MKSIIALIPLFILSPITAHAQLLSEEPSLETYETMAKNGDVEAMVSAGLAYHLGDGVKQDYKAAMTWYLMAFEKADGDALNNIGVMYRDGLGVSKNPKIAYLLFLAVHMNGLGSEATQYRAGGNLNKLMPSMKEDEIYEALSYTWAYVLQVVKSRGEDLSTDEDVLPSAENVRIRDNDWWLDSEKKQMNFESPAPWNKSK
ncbi:tetratricopeptide repeat protein [Persicirhabdus sediminis]|uniref:Sel1 repeat family protein n=1 Tax=Persicirhabdus sediminis TaxID=454144 RepID=A0A8J7SJR6_9BACT|nr:tetratricopeptide repeat protein [Persicirhabdus sediminis]MBK1791534.1 sel1 repeat family protein [Persicirhabdus sediminis]